MTWAGSYRATPAVQNFTSATTFAVNKAAGTVAGDLILLSCAGANGGSYSCPGFAATPLLWESQLLYRTADGTEGSTFTVTCTATSTPAIIQATIAGPCSIDVVGVANDGLPSINPAATGLTVAASNELLIWFGLAINVSSVGVPVAAVVPSGFTSRVTGTAGTAYLPDVLMCDNTAVAAGATGSVAATNATSNYWAAQMVAVKPVAALPVPVYRAAPAVQDFARSEEHTSE